MNKARLVSLLAIPALAAGIVGLASPAQATAYQGCNDTTFCLYQAKNYAQEIWHTSYSNIYNSTSGSVTHCLTIGSAKWTNGTYVGNNTGSMVANNYTPALPWPAFNLYFFNEDNCNPAGGYDIMPGGQDLARPTLSDWFYPNQPSISEYHTISSVELIPKA
jgi:hypothetical protein